MLDLGRLVRALQSYVDRLCRPPAHGSARRAANEPSVAAIVPTQLTDFARTAKPAALASATLAAAAFAAAALTAAGRPASSSYVCCELLWPLVPAMAGLRPSALVEGVACPAAPSERLRAPNLSLIHI